MDKIPKYILDLGEHAKKTFETAEKVANSPAVQDAFKKANEVFETIGAAARAMSQAAIALSSGIAGVVQKYDFKPLIEGLQRYILPLQYIEILRRMKWPLYFIEDESFRSAIIEACSRQDDYDAIKDIALSYCNEEFIAGIREEWKNNPVITKKRFPILAEALDLYNQGAHYGSTSILMCQLYGIFNDIVVLAQSKDLKLSNDEKDLLAEHFHLNRQYLDKSEKGRLFQTVFFTESGIMLWEAMVEYLRDEILLSSQDTMVESDQPLRNKICHGEQLNFGTKEHSLKAILTIDMLMQLALAIEDISVVDDPEE